MSIFSHRRNGSEIDEWLAADHAQSLAGARRDALPGIVLLVESAIGKV
jgi:hypothetical protein